MITMRQFASRFIPLGQMGKFDREPASLDRIQSTVVTFDIVVILLGLAVVAYHLHAFCHRFVIGGDGPGFSARAQILPRIEAKSCRFAHGTSTPPGILFFGEVLGAV